MQKVLFIFIQLITTIISTFFPALKQKINKQQVEQVEKAIDIAGDIVEKINPNAKEIVDIAEKAVHQVEEELK